MISTSAAVEFSTIEMPKIMISRGPDPIRLAWNKHKWRAPSVRFSTQCQLKSTRLQSVDILRLGSPSDIVVYAGPRAHEKTPLGQKRGVAAASETPKSCNNRPWPLVCIWPASVGLTNVTMPAPGARLPAATPTGVSGFAPQRSRAPNLHSSPVLDSEDYACRWSGSDVMLEVPMSMKSGITGWAQLNSLAE